MEPEAIFRQCLDRQKMNGYMVDRNMWFQWRDGRNPPRVSPWGAISILLNSDSHGNFIFPKVKLWKQVVDHLGVDDSWLQSFAKGFDGEVISSMWQSQMSTSELNAYQLGRTLASEYLFG